ncbi:MAG TPA: pre-peptidase C-terminal domain-containing protein [Myxococcota bacterium]|nr:pre-peptidase C-terminal domain-containing protein [Myxococcota bacterium]HRY95491.1 pre-peptidase C-terminal domain-containing protein [Myxococcota bacterium]HSA21737.1 pre-peptidase C-terminal domain-containing protein [Myxococcota bacterium]
MLRVRVLSPLLVLLVGVTWTLAGCGQEISPPDGGPPDGGGDGGGCALVCSAPEDCCAGLQCIDGVCTSLETPCPSGCNFECDRLHGYTCNRFSLRCEERPAPATCLSDCDCYAGEACASSVCSPRCEADAACPAGQVCEAGICQPVSCQTREDCVGDGCQVCRGGVCAAPAAVCLGDEDCCVGFFCNFGECAADQSGCIADSECVNPALPLCVEAKCVARETDCAIDADCPAAGQVCQDGFCVQPGCSLESCPAGQWCELGAGLCKPGCDSNSDCPAPATCNYGTHQCQQTDCCGGLCTAGSQVCDPLTCQCENVCTGDDDCPPTTVCRLADGQCVCDATSCPAGSHCDAATGACAQDPVGCDPATEFTAPIQCGGTASSSFEPGCESTQRAGSYAKQYVLQGTAGQVLTIDLSSTVDTYLYLLGPGGAQLAYNDDGESIRESQIVYALSASGSYTIEATTYAADTSGAFTLRVTCADAGDCSAAIACGGSASGTLAPGCVSTQDPYAYARAYTFAGSAGDRVTLALSSPDFDAYLYLLGPGGALLDEDDDGGSGLDSLLSATLPTSGTYTVEATTYSSATGGDFTLTLTCGGGDDCTGSIACGDSLQGNFSPACEAPDRYGSYGFVYLFEAQADQDITINLKSDAVDPFLILLDPDGFLQDYDDNSGSGDDARIRGTILEGGTWMIEATTYYSGETGPYTLSLTCN